MTNKLFAEGMAFALVQMNLVESCDPLSAAREVISDAGLTFDQISNLVKCLPPQDLDVLKIIFEVNDANPA